MGIGIPPDRAGEIMHMLVKTESVLDRLKSPSEEARGTDIVKRAENWFQQAEARGTELGKFESLFSGLRTIGSTLLMWQAHDAYVLDLPDAVPILCRTALEDDLSIRYLVANKLVADVVAGKRFKVLADGKTPADLERLIQWASTEKILTDTTLPMAKDIQEVGNDYVHAYAMRRAVKPMSGTGNLFTNSRALEVYEKTLKVLNQMP